MKYDEIKLKIMQWQALFMCWAMFCAEYRWAMPCAEVTTQVLLQPSHDTLFLKKQRMGVAVQNR